MNSTLLGGLQLGLGALGMIGQNGLASAQQGYYNNAAQVLGEQAQAYKQGLGIAENYNPQQETQNAVNYAGQVSADSLTKALTGLNQQFAAEGGNPAGDTAFNVNAQGAANRVADPLKEWAAQQYSNATQLKLGALGQAVGAGGGLASGYEGLASSSAPNYGPSASMLSSGLNSLYMGMPAGSGLGQGTAGAGSNGSGMAPGMFGSAGTSGAGAVTPQSAPGSSRNVPLT